MALINIQSDDHKKIQKMFATEKRQLMLKDYLRDDDLSSCSSSGFKSFPRRQCCTTVRFLLEMDLKTSNSAIGKQQLLKRNRSKSAFQRASKAVLSAIKYLPFFLPVKPLPPHSVPKSGTRRLILPRRFSRKFPRMSFWKKADRDDREIGRWRSFGELLEENNEASGQNAAAVDTTTTKISTTTTTGRINSNSKSNGNSWSESEFTADILPSPSGNSESSSVTDGNEVKNDSQATEVSNRIGATGGEDSVNSTKQDWPNEEGKEQLSPVSVLVNPFEDVEENSSPFQRLLVQVEGTKLKLIPKIRRFESLAQLEPVDLERRLASSNLEDELPRPMPIDGEDKSISDEPKMEKITEAEDLLKIFKYKTPSNNKLKFTADSVLLDFFRERIVQGGINGQGEFDEKETWKMAEEWVNGQGRELILRWEVKEGRKAYLKDMERNGKWRNLEEAREEVAAEMELEMLTSLVQELLIEVYCT